MGSRISQPYDIIVSNQLVLDLAIKNLSISPWLAQLSGRRWKVNYIDFDSPSYHMIWFYIYSIHQMWVSQLIREARLGVVPVTLNLILRKFVLIASRKALPFKSDS